MTNDPVTDALKRAGVDPSPAFESSLESLLADAFDGEPIATSVSSVSRSAHRLIVSAAAIAVVAAAVVAAVIVVNHDSGGHTVVEAPSPGTSAPPNTQTTPAPSTSLSPTPNTVGESIVPSSSTATTTSTTSSTTVTTLPTATPVTIDLTTASPTLQPTIVASYPISPPGDLFPTAYATPVGGDRIAVLDDVTGVVRFIDATTGAELASYPTPVPTIGSQSFIATSILVGPDDVMYVNVMNADGNEGPTLIAYGRSGEAYTEVARVQHGVGDSTLTLGTTGVSLIGGMNDPIMPYVDDAGQPSGATLNITDIAITSDPVTVGHLERGDRMWNVEYTMSTDVGWPPIDSCLACINAELGPNATVVLATTAPKPDGDIQTKLTVLSDTVTTYDTDWTYVGALGDKLLFTHLDQDSIDIGTVTI